MLLLVIPGLVMSQDCKVLVENLAETYEGECKKGLAHGDGKAKGVDEYEGEFRKGFPDGDGVYVWANGDRYEGEFSKGMRDGKGEMKMIILGRDSVLVGYWEDDEYKGKENLPDYRITQERNVDNVRITKLGSTGNQITINFYRLGSRNPDITNLLVESSDGIGVVRNGIVEYDADRFPFSGGVTYQTSNKLRTTTLNVIVRFTINYPGVWQIDISN